MAKQAALAFVRRTLDRCHKFEETGTSCFSEPVYRDILLSMASNVNGTRQAEAIADGESTKSYASTRCLEGSLSGIYFGSPEQIICSIYPISADAFPFTTMFSFV